MSSFGRLFRVSVYGESHGAEVGVVVTGCKAGIRLSTADFARDIQRRKTGATGTSQRSEPDIPMIKSGVYNGFTTGAPIAIAFANADANSSSYDFDGFFRPSHADYAAHVKYGGYNDPRGGGHLSGRLTLPIVAAGVIAKKLMPQLTFASQVVYVGGKTDIEGELADCLATHDSAGGCVECRISNVPAGCGEPIFDNAESYIAHAVFAIPGAKAIEFGEGLKCSKSRGSLCNDRFTSADGTTATNNAGGICGGITNGNDLVFRTFFKPTPSIGIPQQTFNFNTGTQGRLVIDGRHDCCFALRTPVIVEAAAAIALADLKLIANV